MTTKEQERKALEKIREIVEELGENSYIGMAFEGCFEIAENNIENDFGCSMKQRAESAESREAEAREALDLMKRHYENLCADHQNLGEKFDKKEERINDLLKEQQGLSDQLTEAHIKLHYTLEKNEALKLEILKLKAKLYDYMVKED